MTVRSWDLTALLNAADPDSTPPERNLWLGAAAGVNLRHAASGDAQDEGQPCPVRYTAAAAAAQALLNVLERHPDHAQRFAGVGRASGTELDTSLFADVGFAPQLL